MNTTAKHAITILKWDNSYINDVMTGKVFKVKGTNFDKKSASLAQWLESEIMVNNSPYLEKLARSIVNNKKLPYGLTLSPELNQEIKNGQFNEKSIKDSILKREFHIEDGVGCNSIADISQLAGLRLRGLVGKSKGLLIDLGYEVFEELR